MSQNLKSHYKEKVVPLLMETFEYKNIQEDDIDEASMTGTGASFTAGSGAGYMTPNAFKKKKKK